METGREQKLVVIALIRDDRGRILVQRRMASAFGAAEGKWEFPGGKVDFGESPQAALLREVREEVGLEVDLQGMLPVVQERTWQRRDGSTVQAFVLCFLAQYVSGQVRLEEGKASEYQWCTAAQLASLDCLPGIPAFMAADTERLTS